jgi:predicted RNA-binding protein
LPIKNMIFSRLAILEHCYIVRGGLEWRGIMCESSVYVVKGQTKEIFMKDVVKASIEGDKVTFTNIIGERRSVAGRLAEVNLLGHSLTVVAD